MPIEILNNGSLIQFGFGDVIIHHGEFENEPAIKELIFTQDHSSHVIGDYLPEERWPEFYGKKTDEFPYAVRLQFSLSKSIDILVEELLKIKAELEENK
jgi:hypothetical protein